jgi:predicted nuclease of predicted toxin-antitoxin system
MKLLLDESIDVRFRDRIVGHDVFTVAYMGWKGTKNGALIAKAAADGFDALMTTDQRIADQQNVSTLPLALVILRARSNNIADLEALVQPLLRELNHLPARSVVHVHA